MAMNFVPRGLLRYGRLNNSEYNEMFCVAKVSSKITNFTNARTYNKFNSTYSHEK